MQTNRVSSIAAAAIALCAVAGTAAAQGSTPEQIQRGRYMIVTGHCNVCHTPGYGPKAGAVPESEWLVGNTIGFRMPPGTSYPSNLRLTVPAYTEDQWVAYARTAKMRPPMPYWALHQTTEQDLRAMYEFIRHLGPAGKPAPAFLPPDVEPPLPYEIRRVVTQ